MHPSMDASCHWHVALRSICGFDHVWHYDSAGEPVASIEHRVSDVVRLLADYSEALIMLACICGGVLEVGIIMGIVSVVAGFLWPCRKKKCECKSH